MFRFSGTHTYAILEISQAAYDEIKAKIAEVEQEDRVHQHSDREVIDMIGIAVSVEKPK